MGRSGRGREGDPYVGLRRRFSDCHSRERRRVGVALACAARAHLDRCVALQSRESVAGQRRPCTASPIKGSAWAGRQPRLLAAACDEGGTPASRRWGAGAGRVGSARFLAGSSRRRAQEVPPSALRALSGRPVRGRWPSNPREGDGVERVGESGDAGADGVQGLRADGRQARRAHRGSRDA
jgi:hypothetical protein